MPQDKHETLTDVLFPPSQACVAGSDCFFSDFEHSATKYLVLMFLTGKIPPTSLFLYHISFIKSMIHLTLLNSLVYLL